jgi:hypothetical protein
MIASPLRELARRYARQEMNLASYREHRTDYLEDVLGGRIKVQYRDTLTSDPIAAQRKASFDWRDPGSYTDFSDRRVRLGAAAILATIVALSIGLYEPPPPPPAPIDAIVIDPAGIERVKALLAEEIWTEDQLLEFASAWEVLTEAQRRFARLDPSYRRYRARIRQIIQDQQALAGLGDDRAAAYALFLETVRQRIESTREDTP